MGTFVKAMEVLDTLKLGVGRHQPRIVMGRKSRGDLRCEHHEVYDFMTISFGSDVQSSVSILPLY